MRTIEQLESEIRARGARFVYSPSEVAFEIDGRQVAREPLPTVRFTIDGEEYESPFAPIPTTLNYPGPVCTDAVARYLQMTPEEAEAFGATWEAQARVFQDIANSLAAEIRVPREVNLITTRPGFNGRARLK